jgi:hypothetical protein
MLFNLPKVHPQLPERPLFYPTAGPIFCTRAVGARASSGKAIKNHGTQRVIVLDAYAALHRTITELNQWDGNAKCWDAIPQVLNNVVEQDHRRIKQRIRPLLGLTMNMYGFRAA